MISLDNSAEQQSIEVVNMDFYPVSPFDNGSNNCGSSCGNNNDNLNNDLMMRQAESMDALFAMIRNEENLPRVDYFARASRNLLQESSSDSWKDASRDASRNVLRDASRDSFRDPQSSDSESSYQEEEDDENSAPVNELDREKMCEWYYEMADFLKIDRSTASRSMSYLDRFMSSHSPQAELAYKLRDEYQLAALASLYISIKLFERLSIKPSHVSYLSRGRYTPQEVVEMESAVLAALDWRVTTPTKLDFADLILDANFPSIGRDAVHSPSSSNGFNNGPGNGPSNGPGNDSSSGSTFSSGPASAFTSPCAPKDNLPQGNPASSNRASGSLRDLTRLQLQLSDFDYAFSLQKSSVVAMAAVVNAYEMKKNKLSREEQSSFLTSMTSILATFDRNELACTVDRLRALVNPSSHCCPSAPGNSVIYYAPCPSSNNASDLLGGCEDIQESALQAMEMNLTNMASFLCCGTSLDEEDGGELPRKTRPPKERNTHSPKTIATILFGLQT